jgi:hypothetical protein
MPISRVSYNDLPGAGHTLVISGHAAFGRPISYEVLGHEIEFPALRDCKVDRIVFTSLRTLSPKGRIIAANLLQIAPPDKRRTRVANEIPQDKERVDISSRIALLPIMGDDDVVLIDVFGIAVDKPYPFVTILHDGAALAPSRSRPRFATLLNPTPTSWPMIAANDW